MSMRMLSTRGIAPPASISDAIAAGLAPDGGLYMPETLPRFTPTDFDGDATLAQVGKHLLRPFFAGDVLEGELDAICDAAFAIDPPLRAFGETNDYILELFHGATAAFKDYGAGFLAAALAALPRGDKPLTIVVATSGDTGAAVGAAFHRKPGVRVAILYPDGRVSPRQAHQLGCFGDNVRAFRVAGSFDDCQRLVKTLLSDAAFKQEVPLGSANSISLGRLLACFIARRMGLPIGELVLANNANDALAKFFEGGDYAPQPSIATLANAMDVGAPNNFERLQWLEPDAASLRAQLSAESVGDDAIRATIVDTWKRYGETVCPHTACAVRVLQRLRTRGVDGDWAAVSTAHPAKFPEVVEPLIGQEVPLPPALATMLERPSHAQPLADDAEALRDLLRKP